MSMKKISLWFKILAALLSVMMCVTVAYNYMKMVWGIKYEGYSAPASTAFLTAVPFVIGIAVCIVLSIYFGKKAD